MPIPVNIAPIWSFLYDESVAVHAYWKLFKQLFGGSQDDLDLLNRSAGFCFFVIQDALVTDVQLTLSKLSDPAKTGAKTNATTEHLLDEICGLGWPQPTDALRLLWQAFVDSCATVRLSRNKMIAHLDRATALQTGVTAALPTTTVGEISTALAALAAFMNGVAEYFGEAPTGYELFIMRGEGGDDLVYVLRMAERYQTLQGEGKIPLDDVP